MTEQRHQERQQTVAFLVFCVCAYLLTAPGRIVFPDDEIVYQTTASLGERGALDIQGIPRRTGEPKGRPNGTFGWAEGTDGRRYGFFGHGLSVVALPAYGLGTLAARRAPPTWRHAVRSNHFSVHRRSQAADWPRLVVSLTNCLLTPLAAWLLIVWVRALGFRRSTAVLLGFAFAFGTLAWPYTRTFLSEPLSTVLLLLGAVAVTRYHHHRSAALPRARRWLWLAAVAAGASVHTHLLNLIAVPCLIGYAYGPVWKSGLGPGERGAWLGALGLGALAVLGLAADQWLRFGDPWESGRHGLYSHFIVPTTELLALVVSPGRSLWLTSPVLLAALAGVRALHSRMPGPAWFCLALVATRLVFVASRSDWWGGWAIGPRFLIPLLPFALLPLAAAWERASARVRAGLLALLTASVGLQAHLSIYSIFEWMLRLLKRYPDEPGYLWMSHWSLAGNPVLGFTELEPDVLAWGAVRLAQHGHPGLAWVFGAIAGLGVSSLAIVVWTSVRLRLRPATPAGDSPRHVFEEAGQDRVAGR